MQERTAANGGDIVAVGAPNDTVGTAAKAGSVALFINGVYQTRLTAPTPAANALFGHSVDVGDVNVDGVGDGLIVVGAPGENRAYLYDAAGALVATFTPPAGLANVDQFGYGVAIDDDGDTIVVGSTAGHNGSALNGAAYIFTREDGAEWADAPADANHSVTNRVAHRSLNKNIGGVVDISGDGKVLIIGADSYDASGSNANNKNGGVLVFVRDVLVNGNPTTDWTGHGSSPNATLLVPEAMQQMAGIHTGASVAISYNGNAIVAGAAGKSDTASWAGAAYIWVRGGWVGANVFNNGIALTDEDSANGGLFGRTVAISDSGDRVIVSNAYKAKVTTTQNADGEEVTESTYHEGEAHIFNKANTSWTASSAANTVLESPQTVAPAAAANLFFGSAVALDGENTVVIGQTERTDFVGANIATGHGRAYAFDLSAADAQASALRLNGDLVCSSKTLDGTTTWTCAVDLGTTARGEIPMITIPAGTPDGAFTISANFTVDGKKLTATLPVKIGKVKEADHAEFDFAQDPGKADITGDEEPYPTNIAVGENTQLRLQILSSVDKPAGADSVSSLLFTTTSGTLTLLKPDGAAMGDCDLTCQVDVTKLNASNSGDIVVRLTHPGATNKASSTMVRAQVLAKGGGALLEIDPVTVTFSGEATKLTISEPATGVLNINTAAGDTGSDAVKDARETRDRLLLSVSLADANGSNVKALPRGSTTTRIMDPDGKVVWRTGDGGNFEVTWPLKGAEITSDDRVILFDVLDADGNRQVHLDVNAAPTAPLKNGEYTLEVKAGSLVDTQTFTVSGGPAAIAISEADGELTIGGRFTLTATLSDADGNAVPDGTPVTFKATPTSALAVLVKVQETTTTTDGQASVTYEVTAAGRDSVRVSSGAAGEVRLITTTDSTPAEPPAPLNPADSLNPRMPNDYTTWLGQGTTSAAALLDGLGDGFSAILLWYNGAWLRYGVVDGRPVPGQSNFEVHPGAILWLTSG